MGKDKCLKVEVVRVGGWCLKVAVVRVGGWCSSWRLVLKKLTEHK